MVQIFRRPFGALFGWFNRRRWEFQFRGWSTWGCVLTKPFVSPSYFKALAPACFKSTVNGSNLGHLGSWRGSTVSAGVRARTCKESIQNHFSGQSAASLLGNDRAHPAAFGFFFFSPLFSHFFKSPVCEVSILIAGCEDSTGRSRCGWGGCPLFSWLSFLS